MNRWARYFAVTLALTAVGLSQTLRELRQRHAESALELLTEPQRRMLTGLAASVRHGGA